MTRQRLLLFDVDGTLVDSQHVIYASIVETLGRFGYPAPERSFALGGVGLSLIPAMRRLLGEEAPDALVERAAATYRDVFLALRQLPEHREGLFPGVAETIEGLAGRDDLVLGIATGKSRRGLAAILERFGWHSLFATVQTADDAPSKPDPAMVLQAAAETGLDAGNTMMVGDTSFDMLMARAAGATPIGVAWGHHPVDVLREAGAVTILNEIGDLAAVLDAVVRQRECAP